MTRPSPMTHTRRNLSVFLLLLTGCPLGVRASNLAWLDVDPNVRSAALGGCGVAATLDPDAAALNPALLGWIQEPELSMMHNQWFDDQTLEHAGFGMPVHKDLGAALLFDYANLGSVQGTRVGSDGYVYPTETYQPRGFRVGGGFGKKWGAFGVGAALHGVFESGFTENQGGLLWGTGLAFRPIRGPWLAGLYVQGSSGPASGDSHSLEFRPALAAHFEKGAHSSFLGTVEGSFGGDNPKGSFKFGGEYAYLTKYFVRCGYRWYADSSELAGLRGISGGLGWRSNTWALNYALTTLGTLGVGHQLSLQVYFKRNETKAGVPVTPLKKKGSAKTVSPTETPTPLPTMVETSSPTSGAEETQSSSESEMLDWYRKGMTAYHNQRYGQAFMDLEKAVGIQDPSVKDFYYAEAYATLGALYQHHRTGEDHLDQARKCYLRALKKDPDTENAKKGLQELDEATQKQDLRK